MKPELPDIFNFNFDNIHVDKPWRKPGADLSDYFNYGFNEDLWKQHVKKVKQVYDTTEFPETEAIETKLPHTDLPVDMGGLGNPINKELLDFQALELLLKRQEQFFLSQNLAENDFFINFSHFLENSTLGNFSLYSNILYQFWSKAGFTVEKLSRHYHKNSYDNKNGYYDNKDHRKENSGNPDYQYFNPINIDNQRSNVTNTNIDINTFKLNEDNDKFVSVAVKRKGKRIGKASQKLKSKKIKKNN